MTDLRSKSPAFYEQANEGLAPRRALLLRKRSFRRVEIVNMGVPS